MKEKKIILRSPTPEDSSAVAQIIGSLASHIDPDITPVTTAETINRYGPDGLGHFDGVIAEQAGQVIGLCLFSIRFSGWRGASGVFVSDLYVDTSVRTGGLGRRLLHETAKKGLSKNCSFLQLDVDIDNENAIDFYVHLGLHIHKNDIQMFMEEPIFIKFATT
jgi:ribosomal protein S18 acetylase RimI-like enzyme